jgi:hypothetical protein
LTSTVLISCSTRIIIRKITVDDSGYKSEHHQSLLLKYDLPSSAIYRVDGDTVEPLHAGIRYTIQPLEFTQADAQNIDPDHIPQPIIRHSPAPSFILSPTSVIRYEFYCAGIVAVALTP